MKKTLVAYFSASGVTAKLASELASAENADLFEIAPEKRYTSADLDCASPRGRIGVHWKLADGRMRISLSVPANTSADFTPAGAAEKPGLRITRNGKPVAFDGAPLPSGDYEIDYAFAEPAEK